MSCATPEREQIHRVDGRRRAGGLDVLRACLEEGLLARKVAPADEHVRDRRLGGRLRGRLVGSSRAALSNGFKTACSGAFGRRALGCAGPAGSTTLKRRPVDAGPSPASLGRPAGAARAPGRARAERETCRALGVFVGSATNHKGSSAGLGAPTYGHQLFRRSPAGQRRTRALHWLLPCNAPPRPRTRWCSTRPTAQHARLLSSATRCRS